LPWPTKRKNIRAARRSAPFDSPSDPSASLPPPPPRRKDDSLNFSRSQEKLWNYFNLYGICAGNFFQTALNVIAVLGRAAIFYLFSLGFFVFNDALRGIFHLASNKALQTIPNFILL
jgi:hypothetical protein